MCAALQQLLDQLLLEHHIGLIHPLDVLLERVGAVGHAVEHRRRLNSVQERRDIAARQQIDGDELIGAEPSEPPGRLARGGAEHVRAHRRAAHA